MVPTLTRFRGLRNPETSVFGTFFDFACVEGPFLSASSMITESLATLYGPTKSHLQWIKALSKRLQ